MKLRTCPNGHKYDADIYNDQCPFCPSTSKTQVVEGYAGESGHTQVAGVGVETPTRPLSGFGNLPQAGGGNHTVIRHLDGTDNGDESTANDTRRIVGLLVSYDQKSNGAIYPIYEGKTMLGRGSESNIVITNDDGISSKHLLLLYRAAEGKFWVIDQNSSNGTFVNEQFLGDKTELVNGDIIRAGNSRFVFIVIPKF